MALFTGWTGTCCGSFDSSVKLLKISTRGLVMTGRVLVAFELKNLGFNNRLRTHVIRYYFTGGKKIETEKLFWTETLHKDRVPSN